MISGKSDGKPEGLALDDASQEGDEILNVLIFEVVSTVHDSSTLGRSRFEPAMGARILHKGPFSLTEKSTVTEGKMLMLVGGVHCRFVAARLAPRMPLLLRLQSVSLIPVG